MEKFKAHILVVDDDDGIRELVKEYLSQNNYLVTSSNSAEDALEKVKVIKFDLIVLDIMMPGKSGLEFIKENKNFKEPNTEEKLYLIIEHLDELIKEKGDHGLLIARKHISWTCKDFKGASNLRNNLVRAVDKNEVKNLIIKMIKTLNNEKNTLA